MTKHILTIGGSDPFSGGGIQTDLKTFENYQLFGLSTLTCIATAEESKFVIHDVAEEIVASQLATIPQDFIDGIKIGLIHNLKSIAVIKTFLENQKNIPIVLDPVLAFKETKSIGEKEYIRALIEELFPLATIITPNLKEAELLTGHEIKTVAEMQTAAEELFLLGPKAVVIKGGNRLVGDTAVDVYFDGKVKKVFSKEKVLAVTTNGAGCSFASGIASGLVLKKNLIESVEVSKQYVHESIATGVKIDATFGSVWHHGEPINQVNQEEGL